MYCNRCGKEFEGNGNLCSECINNETQKEEVFAGELAEIDKIIDKFFDNPDKPHYQLVFEKIDNAIFTYRTRGENKKIDQAYLKILEFYIKANLDERTHFFRTQNEYVRYYNNLVRLTLENASDKDFYNKIQKEYEENKQKYINRFDEKAEKSKPYYHKKTITITVIVLVISCLLVGFPWIIELISGNNGNNNRQSYNGTTTYQSVSERKNISDTQRRKILQQWNKISGYGTSNLNKVLVNIGDNGMVNLMVVYNNTAHNGMFVSASTSDISSGGYSKNYGDEKFGGTSTYSQFYSTYFNIYKDDKNHIYFSGSEFISFLKE